jgi:CBS domain-containing protein
MGNTNPTAVIGDVAQRNYVVVSPNDSVWKVVAAMRSNDSAFALVAAHDGDLSASHVQGIITRKNIMDVLADDMELFGV